MKSKPIAPEHLSVPAREWFGEVVKDFQLENHHVKLLVGCCEAWDRATEARQAVAKDGAYHRNQLGNIVKHPALGVERDAWITFARLLRELDLDIELPAEAKRPPALRSVR